MAKPNNTSTTVVWIWLHDALERATKAFGSEGLAKERLREWMAYSQLPWSCMSFKGLDADGIADLREKTRNPIVGFIYPSAVYHNGDPAFWRANLEIWWNENENTAREKATGGATARGIKVSLTHLAPLLPEAPREPEEVHGAKKWIAAKAKEMKAANKIPQDITISDFARELASQMRKAAPSDTSLRPIGWKSIKNRLPEWGLWPVTSIK
jgi:hypothetical protein